MKLNQIFLKPVDRNIEGVIKADDETSLRSEVEEYVLTHEVARRMETFLDAYNNYQGANGAWISGFFGSGKSHLLKVLALLLENRPIDGTPALDLFLPKCADNAILRGALQKAVSVPSRSVLFNIDQKADVIAKTQIDALLSVFVKVFDETCGYYGKQGHIATFERDLDGRGLLGAFKQAFREIAGMDWERGREQYLLERDNIAQAYARITGTPPESAAGILDRYRQDYHVSIEDFALQVNDYIERQGDRFRLNFFVDEVGQYIANNTKLMTNLQTIAESLATKCRGRSWIVVTSQQEMKDIIGEMNQQQANDFSKIMARFATRMPLTSQNVAEVIQKRLLAKNAAGGSLLEEIHRQQVNNFDTLFNFSDGSRTYRNYRDHQHFVDSYPFVPYQFDLFQAAIQNLSQHNFFEGRHSSVGERSMLAVFQEVAKRIANQEIGQLATFDLMFEGISATIKAREQTSIAMAERNLANPFARRVLKALFLVKYVKEFKATLHNIRVLMTDAFGQDLLACQRQVEEALALLEQQTYIQRNGDLYEYLTNEEKDVEQEIKNTEVGSDAVAEELGKLIFEQVIRDRKIRFDDNSQDFPFSRKLDDRLVGREYELTIHAVSPFHEFFDDLETLRMRSMGRDELMVILPADERLVQDLLMYKRTEKYVQQNISVTQRDSVRRILNDKSLQNRERLKNLEIRVRELVVGAKLYIGGEESVVPGADALSRVVRAFQALVRRTYPNLRMLHNRNYQESDIDACLRPAAASLLEGDANTLNEAEQEVLAMIQANSRGGLRTTLKTLVERFERKPYGWSLAAIQCTVALLSAHAKLELRQDGSLLEDAALSRALKNTQAHINLVLEPTVEFTAGQVRRLKEFFEDFFDRPAQAGEARELGKETAAAFDALHRTLKDLLANQALYPFLVGLVPPVNALANVLGKPYAFYLVDLPALAEDLLSQKETIIAPIQTFWSGAQKGLYDEARQFFQFENANFEYLEGTEAARLKEILTDAQVYRGNRMQPVRGLIDTLKGKIAEWLKYEKERSAAALDELCQRMEGMEEFSRLTAAQQAELRQAFTAFQRQQEGQALIAKVRDNLRSFEERTFPLLLAKMTQWARPPEGPGKDVEVPPPVQYVPIGSIRVPFNKAALADDADLDSYLEALKKALQKEIQNGKRVQI
jgi:hypothetical protein